MSVYIICIRQYKDDIMKTNCWSKIADELGVSMSCPDPGEYFDVIEMLINGLKKRNFSFVLLAFFNL